MDALRNWWKTTAAIGGVIVAIGGGWAGFGLPTPAWSTDIMRVERQNLGTAVTVYEAQLDRYILRRAQLEEQGVTLSNRELQSLTRQIDRLENDLQNARGRLIQLGD